jgi:tRNA threonylcarbamoyladenosine biosynthesis protein TsaE
VQGLACALGVSGEAVTSPTFTLIHEYAGRTPLTHCDAYRLRDPDEFADLGLDDLFAEDAIAIVEWADRVERYLPRDHLRIEIVSVGPTDREMTLSGSGTRSKRILTQMHNPV